MSAPRPPLRGPSRPDAALLSGVMPPGFDRLTRRHRECLSGVRALKGSKEIAEELGIEKSTVDGYLTEAVKLIGARNRRDAALRWGEYEALSAATDVAASEASSSETIEIIRSDTPDKIGGHSARLVPAPADPPPPVLPDEPIVGAADRIAAAPSRPSPPVSRLPFRRKGQRGNDLSIGDRFIYIQVIALSIAIGFGMLMNGLQALTHLIQFVTHVLS